MNLTQGSWKSESFLVATIIIQLMTYVVVLLNVMVARQVIGFLFLTFIPGIIVLKILKLHNLDLGETILLAVGLSVAFLVALGLLINEMGPLIGISKPLSFGPLMAIINVVILLMAFYSCLVNKNNFDTPSIKSSKLSPLVIPFILLPSISVCGTLLVNASQNNSLLLLMMIMIPLLISLSALSKRLLHPKFYPLVLLMIGIALLFHSSLISNYIYGGDSHPEYQVYKLTRDNSHWDSRSSYTDPQFSKLNGMLSITVLPTVYSTILNMNETWILKIIGPLIFSFISLGLYKFYNINVGKKVAFLSTFFFMANFTFFTEMIGLTRQMFAELFYVLLFFVLFSKKMNPLSKKICFMIFGGALIVSHYAVSYIFMFFIIFTWLFLFLLKKKPKNITASLVVFFFVLLFSWYIYVSRSESFNAIVTIGDNIYTNFFADLFNPGSRGRDVLVGLGIESSPSFWHLIGRIFAYATEFFIVIGFIMLIAKRKKRIFEEEYSVLLATNMAMIAISIALPNFAPSLGMTRLYHILLIFLAPLCILGGEAFFRSTLKLKGRKTESYTLALILIILVTFFLFQTEFIYEITGDFSSSIPLSRHRIGLDAYFHQGFFAEQDVFGAKWLSTNLEDPDHLPVYADKSSINLLISYGMIYTERIDLLSNTTVEYNGIVYLTRTNVIHGIIPGRGGTFNISEIASVLSVMNKFYSNGACEIYKNSTA